MDSRLLIPRRKTSSRLLMRAYSAGLFYGSPNAAKLYSYLLYEGLNYRRRIYHQLLGMWTPTLGTILPDNPLLETAPIYATYSTGIGDNWRFRDEGYGLAVANSCDFVSTLFSQIGIATRIIPGETYPGSGALKQFLARARYDPRQQWRIAVLETDITNYALQNPPPYPQGPLFPTVYCLWSDTNPDFATQPLLPNTISDTYVAEDTDPYAVIDAFLAGASVPSVFAGAQFAESKPWNLA